MNKRKIATWMLTASLAFSALSTVEMAQAGHDDTEPVPVRDYALSIGASVQWDEQTRTVTLQQGEKRLSFQLGARSVLIDGTITPLQAPVQAINGKAVLPLGLLKQAFPLVRHDKGALDTFVPDVVENGSYAGYDLQLKLDEQGNFQAKALISVENRSADRFEDLVFYFLPNVFTAANKPAFMDDAADVEIDEIKVGGVKNDYELEYDRLTIPMSNGLASADQTLVEVSYRFTLPYGGFRFYQTLGNFYLAQWYPMLATYQEGAGWNQQRYRTGTESYHTAHSDFKVEYQIPRGYGIFSTSDQDPAAGSTTGVIEAKQVKEVFLAISKDMEVAREVVDGVEIRVLGRSREQQELDVILGVAGEALHYFQQKIGPYPFKQLDIILDDQEAGGMEYPGIVTVLPRSLFGTMQTTVHEIAHQWFYGMMSNDPYQEGWLDEGLTTLATAMFFFDAQHLSEELAFDYPRRFAERIQNFATPKPSNLPVSDYGTGEIGPYLYGQPAMRMWDLIKQHGGVETGWDFMQTYYQHYAYKQVSTEEFVRFSQTYFGLESPGYFKTWLRLE